MKLTDSQKERLRACAKQQHIKFVALFGSRATGQATKESDYDIAVLTFAEKNIHDFDHYREVVSRFAEILDVADGKLDLTNLNAANILLRYEITTKGELLYGNEDDYEQFKAFAFREYLDAKPLFELEDFLFHKKQKLIEKAIAGI